MYHAGTYAAGATIRIPWNSSGADGASITRSTNGTVAVWKDGGTTQSTTGITDTEDFDAMTGMHMVVIDTSADGTFYSTGSEFHVAVTAATIDTKTVNAWIGGFRLGVVPANVTQWLGTAAATPTVAGVPEVDVTHWIGTAAATPTTAGVPEVDITHIAGSAVSTSTAQLGVNVVNFGGSAGTFASGIPAVNATQWAGGNTSVTNLAVVSRATAGTAQAGGASTITLAASASATTDIFKYSIIYLGGGTGSGQTGTVKSYNGTTKVATIYGSWGVTPDATTVYTIIPGGYAADVADIQSGLATSASISALNNLSAAQVNAEVVDALATDTYAEPGQGAPSATTTIAAKVNYLYKAWRNKKEQTADTWTLYNDDGTTAGQKSTVSDDGTTATRQEIVSGA